MFWKASGRFVNKQLNDLLLEIDSDVIRVFFTVGKVVKCPEEGDIFGNFLVLACSVQIDCYYMYLNEQSYLLFIHETCIPRRTHNERNPSNITFLA